jgi:hypothetical protein
MPNVYEFLSNTLHLQCKWLLYTFSSNERAWNGKWTKGLCFLEGQQSPGRNKAKFVVLVLETMIPHKRTSTWRDRRILKEILVLYGRELKWLVTGPGYFCVSPHSYKCGAPPSLVSDGLRVSGSYEDGPGLPIHFHLVLPLRITGNLRSILITSVRCS